MEEEVRGGMEVSEAKRLRALEEENSRRAAAPVFRTGLLAWRAAAEAAPPPHLRCPNCGNFTLEVIAWLKRAPP